MRHCGETESIPPLKAFVAYDDLAADHRAVAVLRKRLSHSDEPVELKPVLWRFGLMMADAWRDLAAADTIDSEMIVISTSEADAVPASIDAWVATCLAPAPIPLPYREKGPLAGWHSVKRCRS
jgi:hypothetical protein